MVESSSTTRIICNALLAADVVALAASVKDKPELGFAAAALCIHTVHGFCAIIDETMEEGSAMNDVRKFFQRLSATIGFPLMATQIAYGPIHEPWLPLLNLALPVTDLVLYYVMDEKPFDKEMVQFSKIISVGCMVYATMKSDDTLGYFAAAAYLVAELSDAGEEPSEEGWCVTTAIGDYLSTLILFGSLFGYSRGHFG